MFKYFCVAFFMYFSFNINASDEAPFCLESNKSNYTIFNISKYKNVNYETNIYKTPFSDYFIISFKKSLPDDFFNRIIVDKNTTLNKISQILDMFSGKVNESSPDIFFTRMWYKDNNGNENKFIDGIKYYRGGADFNHYKSSTRSYLYLNNNFEEFNFFHEFFHKHRPSRVFNSNINEYFADAAAILTISLIDNFSYSDYKRLYNSIYIYRRDQSKEFNNSDHFNWDFWSNRNIRLSKNEYDNLMDDYKTALKLSRKITLENETINNCVYISENEFNKIVEIDKKIVNKISNKMVDKI